MFRQPYHIPAIRMIWKQVFHQHLVSPAVITILVHVEFFIHGFKLSMKDP